jgi:aerobic carbon-monoxide dehydrogenase medium subunit
MTFLSPRTLDEALEILDHRSDETVVIAGGTDVMIQHARSERPAQRMLHIEKLDDLRGVVCNGSARIGALTSHRTVAEHAELNEIFPSIATAAATVGGWQTQIAGTIGGNICNASPAADLAAPLLVHGAKLRLVSQNGERWIDLNDFFLGRRKTQRLPSELLAEIKLDLPPPRSRDVYLKVGRRSGMEVAIVGLALRLTLAEDLDTITDAHCAVCSVAPRPLRLDSIRAALIGASASKPPMPDLTAILLSSVSPIDDIRGSAGYRTAVLPRLLQRALGHCANGNSDRQGASS